MSPIRPITSNISTIPYEYDGLNRFVRVHENGADPLVAMTYDTVGAARA